MILQCAIQVISGREYIEVANGIAGKDFLKFMEFSYDSSISSLSNEQFKALYLLAVARDACRRADLCKVCRDDEQVTDAIDVLTKRCLVRRSNEQKNKVRFTIENNQLRDYVKGRAPQRLAPFERRAIESVVGATPVQAQSGHVQVEIDQVVAHAIEIARQDKHEAIVFLQTQLQSFGDDPKLLSHLGHWHYRLHNRLVARDLLERAIELGSELPDTFAWLAEVHLKDRQYGEGLRRARQAINYSPSHPKANQIAAQCILEIAQRQRLQIDSEQWRRMLEEALSYAQKSITEHDWSAKAMADNRRADGLIAHAEWLLASTGGGGAPHVWPVSGRY